MVKCNQLWFCFHCKQAVVCSYFSIFWCLSFSFGASDSNKITNKPVPWFLCPLVMDLCFLMSMFSCVISIVNPPLHNFPSDTIDPKFRSRNMCAIFDLTDIIGRLNCTFTADPPPVWGVCFDFRSFLIFPVLDYFW